MISEIWSHLDHVQSSFKISDLINNLHINDEVEGNKVFELTDDNPSFIDSLERTLHFLRISWAALNNQFEFSGLLEYFINKKPRQRILPIMKLKLVLEMKQQNATLKEIWKKYFLKTSTKRAIVKDVSAYKTLKTIWRYSYSSLKEDGYSGLNKWRFDKVLRLDYFKENSKSRVWKI